MQYQDTSRAKPHIIFLLLLAIASTIMLLWVIKDFVMALVVAAILAALAYPFYRKLAGWLGGRRGFAATVTVLLSLVLVVIPLLMLFGILVGEAIDISESAGDWVTTQMQQPQQLREQIDKNAELRRLLPYQDEIIDKVAQLATSIGSFVAQALAAGARGAAEFFFMLFVMLFAMSYFLVDGSAILDSVLRYTPLSVGDRDRLLATYVSVGRATLKSKIVIGIIQGGLGGLAFWFAGIEGAIFWGAMMAVASLVPVIGTALIWVPAVIFLILNGQNAVAIGVGLWCAIVIGTVDNVLQPLLLGKDTQMPDLLVMLSTFGGLALLGAAGILIGPIIGALFITIWKLYGSAVDGAETAAAGAMDKSITKEFVNGTK